MTLAHELGHLVMHSQYQDEDVEAQADSFAAEFLMSEHVIRSQLRALTLGKLCDLKQEWGVSMQALIDAGLTVCEVSEIVGAAPGKSSPFIPGHGGLHLVAYSMRGMWPASRA